MKTVPEKPLVELVHATIGFCGDSGDGMQLVGTEFANVSADSRARFASYHMPKSVLHASVEPSSRKMRNGFGSVLRINAG